jgi:hypothetical protein
MSYSAYLIKEESRKVLLERFPPKFSESIAHHVTYCFPDKVAPPMIEKVKVIGYAENHRLECAVVEVNGGIERPQGGIFHITLSLDRSLGAKPVHSNKVLKKGWQSVEPLELNVEAKLLG